MVNHVSMCIHTVLGTKAVYPTGLSSPFKLKQVKKHAAVAVLLVRHVNSVT